MPHSHTHTQTQRFQCRHIFTDGRRCASPCLRGPAGPEDFCYYHHTTRRPAARSPHSVAATDAIAADATPFTLPNPEDRSAIQHAIGQVLQQIAANAIDPRRAGLLLYGLQIASLNLKRDSRTPNNDSRSEMPEEPVDEVTLDPTLGLLALPAELGSNRPKGTLQRLLEDLTQLDQQEAAAGATQPANEKPAAATLPLLHATAESHLPAPSRNRNDIRMTSVRHPRSLNSPRLSFPGSCTRNARLHRQGGNKFVTSKFVARQVCSEASL